MLVSKKHRPLYLFFLITIIFWSFLVSALPDFFLHGIPLVKEQIRSSIEAFGAMAAISMSLLLLQSHQKNGEKKRGEFFLLSMGFLMMGILGTFVAVSVPGHGYNLLHGLRTIFGSIWFALIWLPACGSYISKKKTVPWIVAFLSVLTGFVVLQFREFLPVMVINGELTSFAIQVNIISGVLLFVTAIYFLLEFLRSSTKGSYLLTCVFILLGLSAFGIRIAVIWSEDWWFWHMQRFLAYTVTYYYIFRSYLQVKNELEEMNKTLENRIAERTAELSIEVAERKKYGSERDEMIAELKEANSQIKILTGILPTCSSCKKIQNSEGNWEQMEYYIQQHSDAQFSHGICLECAKKLYPEMYGELIRIKEIEKDKQR
jgi:hypothetical protein